jgi:4-amino-4-deoxy-L-arabinose transferase-like glycosyltransferase
MAVLSTLAVLVGFVFALPLAWRLTPRPQSVLEVALAGLGLSLGLLSLGMFALGLACTGCLRLGSVLAVEAVVLALGVWLARTGWAGVGWRALPGRAWAWLREDLSRSGAAALLLLGVGLIFLSNVYYPFRDFDALARYAYEARLIFEARGLPADLWGYPQLVQMNYAYAFLAFGAPVEWAAKLTPSVMAAGAVGAALALGRALLDEEAGYLSGLLLLLTPIFGRWAMSGYVDVPVAFMVTMAALALYRWWQRQTAARAAWTGLWFGLALWTKPSALLQLAGAGAFVGLALLEQGGWRERSRWLAIARDGLLVLSVALLVAGPWYARNYVLRGPADIIVSPGAFATDRANPTLLNLLPFRVHPEQFGVGLSFVYWAGVVVTLAAALGIAPGARRPRGEVWGTRLLACLTVPHLLVWWQRFSYNPRHLLTMMPLLAVMAGYTVRLGLGLLRQRWRLAASTALLLVAGLSWPVRLVPYVSAPYHLLLDPLGDVEARRSEALGDAYDIVIAIREEATPGASIYTMDGSISFHLSGYEVRSGYPKNWGPLAEYDYLVVTTRGPTVYETLDREDSEVLVGVANGDPRLQLVAQSDDYTLFRVAIDE